MRKAALFILCFLPFTIYSQVSTGPDIAWQNCYGTSGYDFFTDAIGSSDGGFLAFVIYGAEDGDFLDTLATHSRLLKFDSELNLQWQRSYDDVAFEKILQVDDGIILCGLSYADTGIASENHGSGDFLLIKTDINGNFLWSHCYGSPGNESFLDVRQTSDGGYLITGNSRSSGGDIPFHYGDGFTLDALILKLNSLGVLEWIQVLGGSNDDGIVGLEPGLSGNYTFIIGSYSNDFDLSGADIEGPKFWIFKSNSDGDITDENFIEGNTDFYAVNSTMKMDSNIYFLALGNPLSPNFPAPGHELYDGGIGLINGNLEISKFRQFGGSNSDIAKDFSFQNNNFYIFGYSTSLDFDLPSNYNDGLDNDYWLYSVDTAFNLLWSTNFGGSNSNGEYTYALNSPGFIVSQNNAIYLFTQCQVPDIFPDHDIECGYANPDLDNDTDGWIINLIFQRLYLL